MMTSTKEEAMGLGGSRRKNSTPKPGSVWESRINLHRVKESNDTISYTRAKHSPMRRMWKSGSFKGSPVPITRPRSELSKNSDEKFKEIGVFSDGVMKSSVQIKKMGSVKVIGDGNERNSVQLRKVKSESIKVSNDDKCGGKSKNSLSVLQSVKAKTELAKKNLDGFKETEKIQVIEKLYSGDDCSEFGEYEEKAITSHSENVDRIENEFVDSLGDEDEEDEEWGEEIEVETENKRNSIVAQEKKVTHPVLHHAIIYPIPTKTNPISGHFHGSPTTHSKLQSFVDIVMWTDVSKSAFVFGIGTFVITSSSYSKDLNISFISVVSYLALLYLATVFTFRSLVNRGAIDMEVRDQEYVVGEEEAIWFINLVLPYVNEFLMKFRALFSGDPAITMKLAVLLFILARCGSSITIWKMTKLGFFGVFTVPKLWSSYSSQLTAYGTFWIRRFGDAWNSCSHKKTLGFAIFVLLWNLSSAVARTWTVFMLFVAFKYYQQSSIGDESTQQEVAAESYSGQAGLD